MPAKTLLIDVPKLSKANSYMKDSMIFYIAKKDYNGKPSSFYAAYEYRSKILIWFNRDKEDLKRWIDINIDEIKKRIGERTK